MRPMGKQNCYMYMWGLQEVGKGLNSYFSPGFIMEKELKNKELRPVNGNILRTIRFTVEEVVRGMMVDQSAGVDQIYPKHYGKLEKKLQECWKRYMNTFRHRRGAK